MIEFLFAIKLLNLDIRGFKGQYPSKFSYQMLFKPCYLYEFFEIYVLNFVKLIYFVS